MTDFPGAREWFGSAHLPEPVEGHILQLEHLSFMERVARPRRGLNVMEDSFAEVSDLGEASVFYGLCGRYFRQLFAENLDFRTVLYLPQFFRVLE
jgi:hypothetical protein